MSNLIIVSAGEAERHAADRILGALETSPRVTANCVDGLEQPDPVVTREDAVVLIAGEGWPVRIDASAAHDILMRAHEQRATVHVVLIDNAEDPDASALPAELAYLEDLDWHTVRQEHWADDVADVVEALAAPMPMEAGRVRSSPARQMLMAAALIGVVALLGALLVMSRMWADTPTAVGRWVAEVDYGRGLVREERFDFRQAGGQITGNATWLGVRRAIEGAVQDGERLSFHTRTHENRGSERRELRLDYVGLVAADSIRFTVRSSGGFEERAPVEFTAQRQQD